MQVSDGTPNNVAVPSRLGIPERAKFLRGWAELELTSLTVDPARTRDEQTSAQEGRADRGEGLESRGPSKASMKHRLGDKRANSERKMEANDFSRWRRSRVSHLCV
ncbi:MAG: hypothetical protein QXP20_03115 [Candidatus Bathyarchaeia archaeon]